MKLTEFSIKHYMAVLVMCVGIVVMGGASYVSMPREHFPDVKVPVVNVTTVLDGATPEDVETSVTVPIETELEGVEGITELRSVSTDSISLVTIKFDPEVETETALTRIRDAVDLAKADLPPDAEEPVVKEFSFSGDVPILVYNLVGTEEVALSELFELGERIEDQLKKIEGVLDVKLHGGRDREILIEADPERLKFFDLTLDRVQGVLRGTNKNVSAGAADLATNRLVMRAPGEFQDVGEIFNLVIGAGPDGTPIYIRDVAAVRYSFEDEQSRARLFDFTGSDGERPANEYVEPAKVVSIQIMKRSGANILQLVDDAHAAVRGFDLPEGVRAVTILDSSKEVRMMVSDLENGIGTSLILVLAVILLGLGFRNAILVAWAIPFSMLISIVTLSALGFTLNLMVLYSLILALGMLVDNAIVIVENIYRHHSMGLPKPQAALKGTSEVAWPVIASTATTVGAFGPMIFWPDVMGEFMAFLPKTVITVLLSSLLVALVINPTLCTLLMKVKKGAAKKIDPQTQRPDYPLVRIYGRGLTFLLDRPGWTLTNAFVLLVLVFSLYGTFGAGTEFFPPIDPNSVNVTIRPPEGISIEGSDEMAEAAEARLLGKPGSGYDEPVENLKHVGVTIELEDGIGGVMGEDTGPVTLRMQFVDREYRSESTSDTLSQIRERLEGLDREGRRVAHPLYGGEYNASQPQEGPPTGKAISIDIFGEDLGLMTRVVRDMKSIMGGVDGVAKPSDDAATAQPTLEWSVDRAKAGMFGLDQATVANVIQMNVGGLKTGTFGHGDDEQDILLRTPEEYRTDTARLESIYVPTFLGTSVPLASVASAELVPGPVAIKHFELNRVVNAGSDVEPWVVADADVRKEFQERVEEYTFPPGITYRFGGAAEEQQKSEEFLKKAFVVALFIIAMVLVIQFNSVVVPLIVLCSVVLSFMGVFAGLLIFGMPFGIIMSGIGVISLAGIVVNNAIVLLDAIRQFEARGVALKEAVISAGMIRFRPVLLTAITTILGLLPMAAKLNIDFMNLTYQYNTESSQWWQSMAVVVIFGLLVSTILTLGVVPTLYYVYGRARVGIIKELGWDGNGEPGLDALSTELTRPGSQD